MLNGIVISVSPNPIKEEKRKFKGDADATIAEEFGKHLSSPRKEKD